MIKYGYTILYVENVAHTVDFYEEAFGFQRLFITPENDYAELITGETKIAFASKDLANSNLKNGFQASNLQDKPFAIELGFVTDDVQVTMAQAIAAGATLAQEPIEKPWGQTVAYIRDIDGFLIELCTPIQG